MAKSFNPITGEKGMTLSDSGMSLEDIFGYDGNFEGVKTMIEPRDFILIEEIPDRAHNPEELLIRRGK